jgi:hypothetical protein
MTGADMGISAGEMREAIGRLDAALRDCRWIVAGDRNMALNALARLAHVTQIAEQHGEEACLRWQGGGPLP